MENAQNTLHTKEVCTTCEKTSPGFFTRYKVFLLSRGTLITMANIFTLLLGFILWLLYNRKGEHAGDINSNNLIGTWGTEWWRKFC